MHLRYDCYGASLESKESRHPQVVMRELGITYQHATPQSMADQWWFWDCKGVPAELPRHLTPLELDPHKCVGWGLSQKDADKIAARALGAA